MSFKIHLVIVSVIIIALFVITQFVIGPKKEQVAQGAAVEKSPYTITIERASWGLNCKLSPSEKKTDNYLQSDGVGAKLKENNVLYEISQLCDVKSRCDILIDPSILGEDPMPNCGYKMLQIEYRCFSVDRMRSVKGSEGVLTIDCDKQLATP